MSNCVIMKKEKEYYTSKEAKKILKVSDCKLMHLREEGKIKAVKKGNAFMYSYDSVLNQKKAKKK